MPNEPKQEGEESGEQDAGGEWEDDAPVFAVQIDISRQAKEGAGSEASQKKQDSAQEQEDPAENHDPFSDLQKFLIHIAVRFPCMYAVAAYNFRSSLRYWMASATNSA